MFRRYLLLSGLCLQLRCSGWEEMSCTGDLNLALSPPLLRQVPLQAACFGEGVLGEFLELVSGGLEG